VVVLAALALAIVVRTAYLGGEIVHESAEFGSPTAGIEPAPS
jgi:hypothetical protein